MADFVVDTNVWAMVDNKFDKTQKQELVCVENCYLWLKSLVAGHDKLVTDLSFKIIQEYRANIPRGGLAEAWLNQVMTQPIDRKWVFHQITFDGDGFAQLPAHYEIADKNDRKFVAVALAHTPTPPIVNATDTDWHGERVKLEAAGIALQEVCSAYIEAKRKG